MAAVFAGRNSCERPPFQSILGQSPAIEPPAPAPREFAMLSAVELNSYDKWLETTPAEVLASATALGGWDKVFTSEVPVWASKVRNYFNVLPTTLRRLEKHAAQSALGAKTGPRMTFLANCHQDQTFNRYKRGKPTPLGPAPD